MEKNRTMKHISNEEKASEIVIKIQNSGSLDYDGRRANYMYDAAMEMAKWKDKERKELWRITRNHYQEWAEEQIAKEKQLLIDKACEFLKRNAERYTCLDFNDGCVKAIYDEDELVADFEKAMKGE